MEKSIYEQMEKRTNGDVYFGVVGPVRTGKSAFIKRFMEQLVIPNIEDPYRRERAKDELPQSASGKTIMTSEPKIVPEEAVEIRPDGHSRLSVRLIDSVGYMIPGAVGSDEDGAARMVTTPWSDTELTMEQAAELGTKKVMEQHSSIGIVMTTDGTVTDIPREDYIAAEKRSIEDMKATGKPFVVLVNSQDPTGETATAICRHIQNDFSAPCMALDALTMDMNDIQNVLSLIMAQFPFGEIAFYLPDWVMALDDGNELKQNLFDSILRHAESTKTLAMAEQTLGGIAEETKADSCVVRSVDPGSGRIECAISFPKELFYRMLSEQSGFEVLGDGELMSLLLEMGKMKEKYDKVASALEQVYATGYGVVMPDSTEVELDKPKLLEKNGSYSVKLHAKAPSIHMMRADVETELAPVIGNAQQSQEVFSQMESDYENDLEKLWESNLFGRSLKDMIQDGLAAKAQNLPEEARVKLKGTLGKIINENTGGLICIMF